MAAIKDAFLQVDPTEAKMNRIRVLIADDHPAARKGIQMFLGTDPCTQVVGEAEDCRDAVRKAKSLQPDVILMDLLMPEPCGVETIAEIKSCIPNVKIVVLTMVRYEQAAKIAMAAGADGFLRKDIDGESILRAIHTVRPRNMPPNPRTGWPASRDMAKHAASSRNTLLTDREKEVLEAMVKGLSNRDIAQVLDISENTIKTHVKHIFNKLDVSGRTEAVFLATKLGLILPKQEG